MATNKLVFKGVVVGILPILSGESAKGKWNKSSIIVEDDDRYPQRGLFECFFSGEKVNKFAGLKTGMDVEVEFDMSVNEWSKPADGDKPAREGVSASNNVWKVTVIGEQVQNITAPPATAQSEVATPSPAGSDLPF
jgi:hypothetical protein